YLWTAARDQPLARVEVERPPPFAKLEQPEALARLARELAHQPGWSGGGRRRGQRRANTQPVPLLGEQVAGVDPELGTVRVRPRRVEHQEQHLVQPVGAGR